MKKTLFVLLISLPFGAGWGGVLLAQDLLVCNDRGYKLTSEADATGDGSITYKWSENGIDMGSAYSSASITIAAGKTSNTYTYVRKASSASCSEVESNPFTVVVLAQPDKPTVTPTVAAVCFGADVEFTASGAGAGATYSWSGASGAVSGTGDGTYTLTSPAVGTPQVQAAASVTYTSGTLTPKVCVSTLSAAASAQVKPLPVVTPNATYAWCGTNDMTALGVTVTASDNPVTADSITWYDAPTDGSSIETGDTYDPRPLTSTTSYYVGAVYDGCASNGRTTVTATVNLHEGSIGGAEI
jgi:hypothetical protein